MKRLLMITTIARTLEAFLLPHAAALRERGWRVDAAARGVSAHPWSRTAFDASFDMPWTPSPLSAANLLRAVPRVRALVQEGRYDVVHVHTAVAGFLTRYALRRRSGRAAPRVVYTAHGFHFGPQGTALSSRVLLGLERLAGRWTDALVVINEDDARAARDHRIVPPGRVHHIPGVGIDLETYTPGAVARREVLEVRRGMGLGDSDLLFVMIGRFSRDKRHVDVISALARLIEEGRAAHVAFVGDGPRRAEMERLAARLGLGPWTRFWGFCRDVRPFIRASAATVLPSVREGLPRSVMESLAMEVPVIGTDIRGTRELIGDGCGITVPPRDPRAIAGAMRWVADNPREARAMGARGRTRMRDRFRISMVIERHLGLYGELTPT